MSSPVKTEKLPVFGRVDYRRAVVAELRRVDGTGRLRLPLRFRQELGIAYGDHVEVELREELGSGKVLIVRRVRT